MKNKPLDLLKQLTSNPENLTLDQMDSLIKNSLQCFNEYIQIAQSNNKEAQEQAMQELLEFKDSLQGVAQRITEESGLSMADLFKMMNNKENFTEEQWKSMEEINNSIQNFTASLLNNIMPNDSESSKKTALDKVNKALKEQHVSL